MKRVLLICLWAALALSGAAVAQTATQSSGQTASSQNRVVGEVTAVDAAGGVVRVKTDDGHTVTVNTDGRTALLRVRPGETRAENAEHISLADVKAGDRLFARGQLSEDGQTLNARQLVITSAAAITQAQGERNEDWRRRGIFGRITAVNSSAKEITVESRTREGAQVVTLSLAGNARLLRYAPDSADAANATPVSFSDLKVGDQIRARGDRSQDGARFTAEEVIVGSFIRTGGAVTAINAAANELTIKNAQTGSTLTVKLGQRTTLRRIPAEVAAQLAQQRAQAEQARAQNGGGASQGQERRRGENNAQGGGGQRGAGGGGRNFQQMMESWPAITLADLKKGDVVFVVASAGADASHATAVTVVTGDADFITRVLRFQGGRQQRGPNSPGLPGDVVGGGTSPREQP